MNPRVPPDDTTAATPITFVSRVLELGTTNNILASYPGPIPSFSMFHAREYVEKIGEPGDEATTYCVKFTCCLAYKQNLTIGYSFM